MEQTMNIPIVVEPVENNGFRARSGPPFDLTTEGATRDEAVARMRDQLKTRVQNGTQLVSVEVSAADAQNPWVKFAGMFKDDPYFDEWQQAIAENRRKVDEDPEIP